MARLAPHRGVQATASQARVGELVGELSSATARAESLSKEAASAEGSATELQDRLQAAEARAAELGDALQGAQADIKRAAGKQEELQAELAATQERAQGLEGQVSERDAKLEELAQAHEVERQQIVTILKAKYTKRVDKWKAKVGWLWLPSTKRGWRSNHRRAHTGWVLRATRAKPEGVL